MKFEVGDKVAFYPFGSTRFVGHVVTIINDTELVVLRSDKVKHFMHPKQCRKIVPRAKLPSLWAAFNTNILVEVSQDKDFVEHWNLHIDHKIVEYVPKRSKK